MNIQSSAAVMERAIIEETLKVYFTAFAEQDRARRLALLAQCLTEAAEIWGPSTVFSGYESISEKIESFHARMPGARLVLASGINIFRNTARFAIAIVGADGSIIAKGDAVNEFAEDGRIFRVLPFWEALPPIPESWPNHLARPL
jgi:glutaminase